MRKCTADGHITTDKGEDFDFGSINDSVAALFDSDGMKTNIEHIGETLVNHIKYLRKLGGIGT